MPRMHLLHRGLWLLVPSSLLLLINLFHSFHMFTGSTDIAVLQRHLDAAVLLSNNQAPSPRPPSSSLGLLDLDYIRSHLLNEAPWAESHGSDHHHYLGAGLLYYAMVYAFTCRTIVVLGSGGGFVPRILRQAQRDVERTGIGGPFQLYLIDAHLPSAGWGATFYAENEETVMRREFADIRYMIQTTDQAFQVLQAQGIQIDYLHIDADHSFKQSYQDFKNYFTLLSSNGIVSFHDTCRNATRHCATGVPETLREIQKHPDAYGLQIMDAHYLYRGIAFAIPKEAPALGDDRNFREKWNFCRNNAAALSKRSSGFTKTESLSSLGDFYNCSTSFNIERLEKPCPPGFRRSLQQKDQCIRCLPGMKGENCTAFRYAEKRAVPLTWETHPDMIQRHRLVAAWLAEYNIQHLFEISAVPTTLFHPIQSALTTHPRITSPQWSDEGRMPVLRWLPVRPQDVWRGGDYAATVALESTDALVCLDCERSLFGKDKNSTSTWDRLLLDEFPMLRLVVLEDAVTRKDGPSWLDYTVHIWLATRPGWTKEADLVVSSAAANRTTSKYLTRRLVLLIKSTVTTTAD